MQNLLRLTKEQLFSLPTILRSRLPPWPQETLLTVFQQLLVLYKEMKNQSSFLFKFTLLWWHSTICSDLYCTPTLWLLSFSCMPTSPRSTLHVVISAPCYTQSDHETRKQEPPDKGREDSLKFREWFHSSSKQVVWGLVYSAEGISIDQVPDTICLILQWSESCEHHKQAQLRNQGQLGLHGPYPGLVSRFII